MFFIVVFVLFYVFYVLLFHMDFLCFLTPLGPLLSRNHTEGRGGEAPNSSSFVRRGRGLVAGLGAHGRRLAVREGGPRPGDACRLFGHATTPPRMYEGPVRRSGGIATPQGPCPP